MNPNHTTKCDKLGAGALLSHVGALDPSPLGCFVFDHSSTTSIASFHLKLG